MYEAWRSRNWRSSELTSPQSSSRAFSRVKTRRSRRQSCWCVGSRSGRGMRRTWCRVLVMFSSCKFCLRFSRASARVGLGGTGTGTVSSSASPMCRERGGLTLRGRSGGAISGENRRAYGDCASGVAAARSSTRRVAHALMRRTAGGCSARSSARARRPVGGREAGGACAKAATPLCESPPRGAPNCSSAAIAAKATARA